MPYLLDTGFLYALLNRKEQTHEIVVAPARTIREPIILPVPAVTETAYLLLRDVGPVAVADFIESHDRANPGGAAECGLRPRGRSDSGVRRFPS